MSIEQKDNYDQDTKKEKINNSQDQKDRKKNIEKELSEIHKKEENLKKEEDIDGYLDKSLNTLEDKDPPGFDKLTKEDQDKRKALEQKIMSDSDGASLNGFSDKQKSDYNRISEILYPKTQKAEDRPTVKSPENKKGTNPLIKGYALKKLLGL